MLSDRSLSGCQAVPAQYSQTIWAARRPGEAPPPHGDGGGTPRFEAGQSPKRNLHAAGKRLRGIEAEQQRRPAAGERPEGLKAVAR